MYLFERSLVVNCMVHKISAKEGNTRARAPSPGGCSKLQVGGK